MSEEKKNEVSLKELDRIRDLISKKMVLPPFDPELVSRKTLVIQLRGHETTYFESLIFARAEMKFLNESINFIEDLSSRNAVVVDMAHEYLEKSKSKQEDEAKKILEDNVKNEEFLKAIGNLQNIESKLVEVKNKLWAVEYHSEKIREIKYFLRSYPSVFNFNFNFYGPKK